MSPLATALPIECASHHATQMSTASSVRPTHSRACNARRDHTSTKACASRRAQQERWREVGGVNFQLLRPPSHPVLRQRPPTSLEAETMMNRAVAVVQPPLLPLFHHSPHLSRLHRRLFHLPQLPLRVPMSRDGLIALGLRVRSTKGPNGATWMGHPVLGGHHGGAASRHMRPRTTVFLPALSMHVVHVVEVWDRSQQQRQQLHHLPHHPPFAPQRWLPLLAPLAVRLPSW